MLSRTKALLSAAAIGALFAAAASVPAEAVSARGEAVGVGSNLIPAQTNVLPQAVEPYSSDGYDDGDDDYDEETTGSIGSAPIESFSEETYGRGYNSNGHSYDTYGHIGPRPDRDTTP